VIGVDFLERIADKHEVRVMGSTTPIKDIQSQLSYSYLHAVASRVGCTVTEMPRLADNTGIDAMLTVSGQFSKISTRTDFTIGVQLKSTVQEVQVLKNGVIPLSKLRRSTYDMFRSPNRPHPYLVILLHLPQDRESWLEITPDNMILRKCAYWVDLYGAAETRAKTPTIYFPVQNLFTPDQLENTILRRYAEDQEVTYEF